MTVGLEVLYEDKHGKALLRLSGKLDAATSPNLEKKIEAAIQEGVKFIFLDFSDVDYMSSAGMRLLLSTTKKMKANKGDLILFSIEDEVMEIIKMAGFDRILHVCLDEKEAFSL
jgi:anti-sigma B factor antagonist/stage II sporulation protein AA (anti-sigma F factor antagonist)